MEGSNVHYTALNETSVFLGFEHLQFLVGYLKEIFSQLVLIKPFAIRVNYLLEE